MIDAAKQQWASVMQKPNGAILTAADLLPFLPGNTMPTCPAGGIYTLNPVGQGADLQHPRPRRAEMTLGMISTGVFTFPA